MYAMVCSRPNLAYVDSVLSRYMINPRRSNWKVVKWILRYIKGSLDVGLRFGMDDNIVRIISFTYSNYAGDLDKKKSTTGYIYIYIYICNIWRTCQLKV